MPSPFPGMNPYLEQDDTWEDFHTNFIVRMREVVNELAGPNYFVKIAVCRLIHEFSAEERRRLNRAVDVERHTALEIRDLRNRRVVTLIELLSPSIKMEGAIRDDYLAKRRQLFAEMTHLVEIDLRRGGSRPYPPELLPCDYYVLVSRCEDRPNATLWTIGLRDPLPIIPIPLATPDEPVPLNLRAVLDRAYDAADYGKYIYSETPEPPLTPADAEWARMFLPRPI